MAYIRLKDISVRFPLYTSYTRSLRGNLMSVLGGTIAPHNRSITVNALNDVSIELNDGDRIGLIGHNGAGKTTFLRLIAGVYSPDVGTVETEGSIASFTDITLGMDPEATGWDNIIFRCVFMGLTFKEARRLSPAIAEFSELGEFLAMPVRTYSTGMFLRLGFAISTSINPDIVVMDEMIGTGDQSFIDKAKRRIEELLANSKILVLASHDTDLMHATCNRVLWLEKGRVKMLGAPDEVLSVYTAGSKRPPKLKAVPSQ